tara:strand:- start:762 stop:1274 length:513 start_codon:yes stop_codon:yes gene_type:complete
MTCKYFSQIIVFYFLTILIYGCGIYSFSGASIPENADTININYIKNSADLIQPSLSNLLTEALISKCQAETNLTITNKSSDLLFSGEITKYEVQPVSIQNTEIAAQNRLTISLKINYRNNLDSSLSFEKTFTDYVDFDSNSILSEIEEELSIIIVNNLVEDIFNSVFMNW